MTRSWQTLSILVILASQASSSAAPAIEGAAVGERAQAIQLSEQQKASQEVFVQRMLREDPERWSKTDTRRFLYRVVSGYLSSDVAEAYNFTRFRLLKGGYQRSNIKARAWLGQPGPEKNQQAPNPENTPNNPQALLLAGFKEISESEFNRLLRWTACTREGLQDNSSLRIVREVTKERVLERYFLYNRDPLFAMIAKARSRGKNAKGNIFVGKNQGSYCADSASKAVPLLR